MADPGSLPLPTLADTAIGPASGVSKERSPLVGFVPEPHAACAPGSQQPDANGPARRTCPGCKTTNARNLVVCIDGTSNQFSTKNTNVVELYSRLIKDKTQLTFYNSGIGTYAKPSWKSWGYRKQVIANMLDLAFALRFEKIIISAYAWLVDNYEDGDRIFLFGFSRGAYQVRALAAMIHIVGLLHKGNDDQIPFAYELYAASGDTKKARTAEVPEQSARDVRPLPERISLAWRSARGNRERQPAFPWPARIRTEDTQHHEYESGEEDGITMQAQFKRTFSRKDVRVHFVGAWDTVSSVGFIRDKNLPSTTDGMEFVCFFRHALALHEFRVKFLPEYANGGAGPSEESTDPESGEPHTKEVWFTGSHSDIGGGSTANTNLNKFGPALRWMSWEATLAGLRLLETPDSWAPIGVSKSMTTIWSIVECMPIKRLTYHVDVGSEPSFTLKPHFFARRHILPHQRIHQSVYEECLSFQAPEDVLEELDAYLVLRPQDEALRTGRILGPQSRKSLQRLANSENGIRSLASLDITQYIYDVAGLCRDKPAAVRAQILEDLRELQVAFVTGLFKIDQDIDMQQAADVTETTSSALFPFHMCGHTRTVPSVAFLSGTEVISGSYDKTLRIWDVRTGAMSLGSPFSGHSNILICLAVHATNGLIASASSDTIIRLKTSDRTGAVHAEKILQDGSSTAIRALAFSPDGARLVSGSMDGAIRVWDAATGERVGEPARGHTKPVWSVAFSSDGKRIVSGAGDCTVRLWEWLPGEATLQSCREPFKGHTSSVWAVAFAPDGGVIASGSLDNTVRLWDTETRTPKLTLAHSSSVLSVAFAPGGTHIATGSYDWAVRIWDTRTGAAVRVLRGHTGTVTSVAFSPDGTRIASGSGDKTVRVWDFGLAPDDEDAQAELTQVQPA